MEDTTKLNPSKLGTREYWDNFYNVERVNFEENPEDTGECWFSDSDAEEKMIQFLFDNLGQLRISDTSSMIDIGTGNGHLLFTIREEGFKGQLDGIDYSESSVLFARDIMAESYPDEEAMSFEVADIFADWNLDHKLQYDIVLDKGTLDAIALSEMGAQAVEQYGAIIERLLKKDSILLITSCNFTEAELTKILESETLKVWKTIEYPVFEFGGVKGATICSIAFKKL